MPGGKELRTNQIQLYLNCGMCAKELPPGESPQTYAHTQAGWTKHGIQVWCVRHDMNIIHIDFEGQQHPADLHAIIKEAGN